MSPYEDTGAQNIMLVEEYLHIYHAKHEKLHDIFSGCSVFLVISPIQYPDHDQSKIIIIIINDIFQTQFE